MAFQRNKKIYESKSALICIFFTVRLENALL